MQKDPGCRSAVPKARDGHTHLAIANLLPGIDAGCVGQLNPGRVQIHKGCRAPAPQGGAGLHAGIEVDQPNLLHAIRGVRDRERSAGGVETGHGPLRKGRCNQAQGRRRGK